ncbi:MAG: tRNA(Ile)-lysidine synthase [Planctomycetota bacterium]
MSSPDGDLEYSVESAVRSCLSRWTASGDGVLAAVSGGVDSLVLLRAVAEFGVRTGRRVFAAHLNHNLRGSASAADASLVRRACLDLGVELTEEELPAGFLSEVSAGSLEEAARGARMSFLVRVAKLRGVDLVLTAHHAGDQSETVLYNILRGSGLKGLRGIPEVRELSPGIRLLRPLLGISRRLIEEYAGRLGLEFAVDASNSDLRFTRNRIRHELLPQLRAQFNPAVDEALRRLSEQSGELLEIVDELADELLVRAVLQEDGGGCRLSISVLSSAPVALVRHALVRLWDRRGWPRQRMGAAHWQRVAAAVCAPGVGDFPGGLRVESTAGILRITRLSSMD